MTNVPEKIHAELGASVAARWMACPGSVQLSRGRPTYESEHSRAGTAAHAVAQLCLERGLEPSVYLDTEVEGVRVDEEMVEAVKVFVDYCRSLILFDGVEVGTFRWIEKRFSLASLNPPAPMYGTADFVAYHPGARTLHVVDYKNGSGVVVEAKGNKQLRYYALGAVLSMPAGLEIEQIVMTIVQPRAAHPEGVVRSDHIDYHDLLAFASELMEAARKTLESDAPLHPGSHCRFCPAAPICPAQRTMVQELAQTTFEAMPLDVPPAPESLPPEVFADILNKLHILEDWAASMRLHALRELEAGRSVPGYKLVPKRATRRWANEKQVEKWLWDDLGKRPEDIYKPQEIKSPAQIEKLVGKKNIPPEFIESKSSGYTLAPDHDPRPAYLPSAADHFEALPSGE